MKILLAFLLLSSIACADLKMYYVGATWCSPCQQMKRDVLNKTGPNTLRGVGWRISHYPDTSGHIIICDVDNSKPNFLNPEKVPTIFFIKDNNIVEQFVGFRSAKQISRDFMRLK